jgi:hypothetical protein
MDLVSEKNITRIGVDRDHLAALDRHRGLIGGSVARWSRPTHIIVILLTETGLPSVRLTLQK